MGDRDRTVGDVAANAARYRELLDTIAAAFHEAYERKAPDVGYVGRPEAAVPWGDLPHGLKVLMRATVAELLSRGVIDAGPNVRPADPAP